MPPRVRRTGRIHVVAYLPRRHCANICRTPPVLGLRRSTPCGRRPVPVRVVCPPHRHRNRRDTPGGRRPGRLSETQRRLGCLGSTSGTCLRGGAAWLVAVSQSGVFGPAVAAGAKDAPSPPLPGPGSTVLPSSPTPESTRHPTDEGRGRFSGNAAVARLPWTAAAIGLLGAQWRLVSLGSGCDSSESGTEDRFRWGRCAPLRTSRYSVQSAPVIGVSRSVSSPRGEALWSHRRAVVGRAGG